MSALVLLAPGFEEIEAITVIDVLRRAEESRRSSRASRPTRSPPRGTPGTWPTVRLEDVPISRDFEVVVLPGGVEGAKRLGESRWSAPGSSASANATAGSRRSAPHPPRSRPTAGCGRSRRSSCHPSVNAQFPAAQTLDAERLVVDGKLITGLAAGSAMEFAFEIVRQLRGNDAVHAINHGVCAVV
ncbi:MAG: DJ-1/PfpI family protein [Verrucomicrobiota bacterium]